MPATVLDLEHGDHPLCLERVIVLPYTPHPAVAGCRHRSLQRELPPHKGTRVFFAGSLREKLCGHGPGGEERHFESSHGVRPALTAAALRARYPARFPSLEDVPAMLFKHLGFSLTMMNTSAHGGRRIGGRTDYAKMLFNSVFCLHLRGDTPTSRRLFDAIAAGCLPIAVSDALGANLPFVSNGDVAYSAWLTVISEEAFKRDPLGELESASHIDEKKIEQMRRAMTRDAPRLTLCSGAGGVGDSLLSEAFRKIRQRTARGGSGMTCLAANVASLLPLYVVGSGVGQKEDAERARRSWLQEQERRFNTTWTWCCEEEVAFEEAAGSMGEAPQSIAGRNSAMALRLDRTIHVA